MNSEIDVERKIKAIVLCASLGFWGVHRFYLGKVWTGVLQVLLTLSMFGIYINVIWLIVDVNRIAFNKLK